MECEINCTKMKELFLQYTFQYSFYRFEEGNCVRLILLPWSKATVFLSRLIPLSVLNCNVSDDSTTKMCWLLQQSTWIWLKMICKNYYCLMILVVHRLILLSRSGRRWMYVSKVFYTTILFLFILDRSCWDEKKAHSDKLISKELQWLVLTNLSVNLTNDTRILTYN